MTGIPTGFYLISVYGLFCLSIYPTGSLVGLGQRLTLRRQPRDFYGMASWYAVEGVVIFIAIDALYPVVIATIGNWFLIPFTLFATSALVSFLQREWRHLPYRRRFPPAEVAQGFLGLAVLSFVILLLAGQTVLV